MSDLFQLAFDLLTQPDQSDQAGDPETFERKEFGWRRLMGGVLLQALVEAQSGNPEAIEWLKTDGDYYLQALGWDSVDVEAFIESKFREGRLDIGIRGRGYLKLS